VFKKQVNSGNQVFFGKILVRMQAMKKILVYTLLLTTLSCSRKDDSGNESGVVAITIKGSDTVLPLSQKEAEEFMGKDPNANITVVGGGTGVGLTALIDGTTDIAMASRPLKIEEKLKLKGKKIDYREQIIAFDALAVIVNPKNKVDKLTREQLEGIFTGKIKNWKEVGGSDDQIVIYSRESSSGTFEFFKEHVMDKKNYGQGTLMMPATGSIVQSIGQTKGAIGYVGLAYQTKEVKFLSVSYDEGKTFVAPSIATAKDKSYPIARPLYFFYDVKKEKIVKPFIDFIMSDEGQQIVAAVDYIPVK
jgi:phosphate transport system substrate-binding protein